MRSSIFIPESLLTPCFSLLVEHVLTIRLHDLVHLDVSTMIEREFFPVQMFLNNALVQQSFSAWRRHFYETRPLPITTTIPSLFSLRQFLVRVLHIFPDQGTRSIYRRIWLVDGRDINYILLGYWLHPRSYNSSWCWTAKLYRLSKSLGPRYSCFWVPLRNRISVG